MNRILISFFQSKKPKKANSVVADSKQKIGKPISEKKENIF